MDDKLVVRLSNVPDGWKPLAWAERLEQVAEGLMPSIADQKPAYLEAARRVREKAVRPTFSFSPNPADPITGEQKC